MPDYTGLCERFESRPGWPGRHPLQQLPQEVSSPPSWKSVYKMLVLLLVPALRGWGQLQVSVTPWNYQASLGEQACPRPCAFAFVSYHTDQVWCLGFPSERQGAEKEKEGMKNSARQSSVSSCALSGPSAGSVLRFRGDASKRKWLHVFPLII